MSRLAAVLVMVLAGAFRAMAASPQLTPAPKEVAWTSGQLNLSDTPTIAASGPEEQQVARLLAAEMDRLYKIRPKIAEAAGGARTELALADSATGKARLRQWMACRW